ncbi:MAG TPA: hypothetical protein VHB20_08220 [Verrucomicrobiae bacterium]|jgi:hypothetical protein|nr:hypothetical protein [Verrucomicrobiae bacterium]
MKSFRFVVALGGLVLSLPCLAGPRQFSFQLSINRQGEVSNPNHSYGADLQFTDSDTPVTFDQITSPTGKYTAGAGSGASYGGWAFPDLQPVLDEFTNGPWTLVVDAGSPSEQTYHFAVSVGGISTNDLPDLQIVSPTNSEVNVSTLPLFQWDGPTNATDIQVNTHTDDYSFYNGNDFGADTNASSWTPYNPLPHGINNFEANEFFAATKFSISSLTNQNGQPVSWSTLTQWHAEDSVKFFVGEPPPLLASYSFDDTNNPGADLSGNNYQLGGPSWFTRPPDPAPGILGTWGLLFNGGSWYSFPDAIKNAVEGSYAISAWLATTNVFGNDSDTFGAGIVAAGNNGDPVNDSMPLTQTGSKIALYTGDTGTALHSASSVNTGAFVHVVVSRDVTTGERRIYINGVLDSADFAGTNILANSEEADLGFNWDGFSGWVGVLDELQIYREPIGDSNVLYLFQHPGESVTNLPPEATFDVALNTTNFGWTTSGDAPWFTESSVTFDGAFAAESGLITDNQTSVLEATIMGPGSLTFWWKVSSEQDYDYLDFSLDGDLWDSISGDVDWTQDTVPIGPGTHVLHWDYTKDSGGLDGADTGWLDQVSFVPSGNPPVVGALSNNEVFYAGTTAALESSVTSDSPVTYDWYIYFNIAWADATNDTLIIPNAPASYSTYPFNVVAHNNFGAGSSGQVTITITNDPAPPAVNWTTRPSGTSASAAQVAATDAAGNVLIAGWFSGTATFGTNILTAAQPAALFLAKYDARGSVLWARNLGGGSNNNANVMTLDAAGNILLGGSYQGVATLGSFVLTNAGSYDAYWARLDANGVCQLARRFGGPGSDFVQGIAPAADGSIYVAGAGDSSTLGVAELSGGGTSAGILARYAAAGAVEWVQATASGFALGDDVCVVGTNVFFVGGKFQPISFGGFSLAADGGATFLAKCGTNGACVWLQGEGAHEANTYGYLDFMRMHVRNNQIYLGGQTYGLNASFGAFAFNSVAGRNAYVARFDTNGAFLMARLLGDTNTDVSSMQTDAAGNIYVGGAFSGPTDFGGRWLMNSRGPLNLRTDYGLFAARYGADGALDWTEGSEAMTGNGGVFLTGAIAVAGPDQIYLAGGITNQIYFGAASVASPNGMESAALARFSSVGLPVLLVDLQTVGTSLDFSFQTQASHTYLIQVNTNLAGTNWQTFTNVAGDGGFKTVSTPISAALHPAFYRVQTQ